MTPPPPRLGGVWGVLPPALAQTTDAIDDAGDEQVLSAAVANDKNLTN